MKKNSHRINRYSWQLFAAACLAAALTCGAQTETVDIPISYPSPSGSYIKLVTTGDSGPANTTMPVCSKPAGNTAQGLCDMAGNVFQWVQDKYRDSYIGAPADGRAVEGAGPLRVMRGGSFNCVDALPLRTGFRGRVDPGYRDAGIGFRLAKSR